jgi:hypothetical protein
MHVPKPVDPAQLTTVVGKPRQALDVREREARER